MKIHAPNKEYTGVSASVSFCNGVGETDNPNLIRWFREHGYEVVEAEETVVWQTIDGEEGTWIEPEPESPLDPDQPPEPEAKKGKAASKKAGE